MTGMSGFFKKLNVSTLFVLLLAPGMAFAEVLNIQAEYTPDPTKPSVNQFKNTTPSSGYCEQNPYPCSVWGVFTIKSGITAESKGPILAKHSPRQGPMFKLPAEWRDVEVFPEDGSEPRRVKFRVTAISSTYILSDDAKNLLVPPLPDASVQRAHGMLWGGTMTNYDPGLWTNAPRPCTRPVNTAVAYPRTFSFYWTVPSECGKQAAFDIPSLSYAPIEIMYEMIAPDPLAMASGNYEGELNYRVGPGLDFDLGDMMEASDDLLSLKFRLQVNHIFKITIPSGGTKIDLLPEGGWQAWLNQGRRPTRLFRDQVFNIYTSTAFKMRMECQHYAQNSTCALQDDKGDQVPLDVSVTLPSGLRDAELQSVSRRRLRVDGVGTENFAPSQYIDRKPGTLHFEVSKDAVEDMLQRDSLRYSGNVIVVWDSQI